jgi:hypothetical protein
MLSFFRRVVQASQASAAYAPCIYVPPAMPFSTKSYQDRMNEAAAPKQSRLSRTCLTHTIDRFAGVTVNLANVSSPSEFGQRLGKSLDTWAAQGLCAIWLPVPLDRANLIPVAAEHHFVFHHARAHQVMMTRWLPGLAEPDMTPAAASTTLGVGCLVLNSLGQCLVVQARGNTHLRARKRSSRFPLSPHLRKDMLSAARAARAPKAFSLLNR